MSKIEPIIGLRVSKFASAQSIVCQVEQALMQVTDREVTLKDGRICAMIYVVQALPYVVGITQSPWSPNYPSRAEAIAKCMEHAPVQIEVRP